MSPCLHLDAARLGAMSSGAELALKAFAQLAGEGMLSIPTEDLVWAEGNKLNPTKSKPITIPQWTGLEDFKSCLKRLGHFSADTKVLVAARSAQLMKLAAMLLCRPCRNILVTDLGWPAYHGILAQECQRTGRKTTQVSLLDGVFNEQWDEERTAKEIAKAYVENNCDGLFLTTVSNHGVRLPIRKTLSYVEASAEVRFVVLDGAQEFGHVADNLDVPAADLYLSGAHKWLGGHCPLGFGFYRATRSASVIETVLNDCLIHALLDDPLLKFIEQSASDLGETVSLAPLFTAQGAAADALSEGKVELASYATRLQNADKIAEVISYARWRPRRPDVSLRSGMILVEPIERASSCSASDWRRAFFEEQVVLTAYDRGRLRLSMPHEPMTNSALAHVESAFRNALQK